jgi:ferredoxin
VVPQVVERPGRYLKYLVLAVIVAGSAATASLFIRPYDPWAAWHHILSVELVSGFLVGLILLAVSLAGSVLYERFFCKYLCPMGAFLGLIHRLGWFRVKRIEATCTHCHACNKACPVGIQVEAMSQVQSAECINCNLCVEACPVADTLVTAGPKRGKISSFAMLGITAGVFVAVMSITTALGGFEWTVKSLAERAKSGSVERRGEAAETRDAQAPVVGPSAENVTAPAQTAAKKAPAAMAPAAKGALGTSPQKAAEPARVEPAAADGPDPQVIKGSDTFQQVAETFGVTKDVLMERFVITDKEFGGPIRDVAHREGATFEVQDVRDFVAQHLKK